LHEIKDVDHEYAPAWAHLELYRVLFSCPQQGYILTEVHLLPNSLESCDQIMFLTVCNEGRIYVTPVV